jgi:hypothetical protein
MESFNVKKFQNTPRNEKGIASIGAKRVRFEPPVILYTKPSGTPRIKVLHPTKGYRDMSMRRIGRH